MEASGERYRMLDTVRAYAREKLAFADDDAGTCSRHLDYFVAFAEAARPQLFGEQQSQWLVRIDLDRENLMAAHAWCDRAENGADTGLRLSFALKAYCLFSGLLDLGRRLCIEAVQRPGAQARTIARCRGLCDAGQFCCFTGHYAEAVGLLDASLSIARELDDHARIAVVLQPLSMASVGLGDLARARACSEEAVTLARGQGKPREIAAALIALAQILRMDGRIDLAEPLYQEAVAIARTASDRMSVGIGLLNLAMVGIGRGATAAAQALLREAIGLAREQGMLAVGQSAIEVTCALCAQLGALTEAARFFGAAEAQAERAGLRRDAVDEAFLSPIVARVNAALGIAPFAAAEAEGRALAYDEALRQAQRWIERLSDVEA
jgi:non-specific serine/threonine protein kinase